MMEENKQVFDSIHRLVEAWCDRRCFGALKSILPAYPLSSPLTDGWGELLIALQDVRAFAREELTPEERKTVDDCIRAVENSLHRD